MTQSATAATPADLAKQTPGKDDETPEGPLTTEKGTTKIADSVVSKIAGIAAQEIPGVHALGGGTARAVGALRERLPGASSDSGQGVKVEVGTRQAAIDIDLVADYGVPLADLADDVRQNVISSVERMTALEVTEVNVQVNDVYVPGEHSDDEEESRVE